MSTYLWSAFMLIVVSCWLLYLHAFNDGTVEQVTRTGLIVAAIGLGSLISVLGLI